VPARGCLPHWPPAGASCRNLLLSRLRSLYWNAIVCLSSMTEFRIRSGPHAGLETSLAASSFPREVNLMAVLT
jgi:hypothetical protein